MSDVGRRDRKKRQTRAAIERASVSLVAETDLSHVTVEAIAERADITTRTFFNHFADKESAVLGIARDADDLDGSAALTLAEGEPLQVGLTLIRGLLHAMGESQPGLDDDRRRVLARHPELLARQIERYVVVEDRLNGLLVQAMERNGVPEPDRSRRARASTFLLIAAARLAMEDWCRESGSDRDPSLYLDAALATLRDTINEQT